MTLRSGDDPRFDSGCDSAALVFRGQAQQTLVYVMLREQLSIKRRCRVLIHFSKNIYFVRPCPLSIGDIVVKERQPPLQENENLRKTQDFPLVLGPWTDPGRGGHRALRGRKVAVGPEGAGLPGDTFGSEAGRREERDVQAESSWCRPGHSGEHSARLSAGLETGAGSRRAFVPRAQGRHGRRGGLGEKLPPSCRGSPVGHTRPPSRPSTAGPASQGRCRALEIVSSAQLKGTEDVITRVRVLKKVCPSHSRCSHLPRAEGRVGTAALDADPGTWTQASSAACRPCSYNLLSASLGHKLPLRLNADDPGGTSRS